MEIARNRPAFCLNCGANFRTDVEHAYGIVYGMPPPDAPVPGCCGKAECIEATAPLVETCYRILREFGNR